MATRINARLDSRSAADLELIRRETGASSISDALKYSLHEVAERLRSEARTSGLVMRAFLDSDYVGHASGPEETLSEDYKAFLDADLRNKHDLG